MRLDSYQRGNSFMSLDKTKTEYIVCCHDKIERKHWMRTYKSKDDAEKAYGKWIS